MMAKVLKLFSLKNIRQITFFFKAGTGFGQSTTGASGASALNPAGNTGILI
jgi:hypothetical protein